MADYEFPGDAAHQRAMREEDESRRAVAKARASAELDGFLSAGIYTVDSSGIHRSKKVPVQGVMLCGICFSLVPLDYVEQHADRERARGERND